MENRMNLNFATLLRCSLVLLLSVKADEYRNGFIHNTDRMHTPTCIRDDKVCNIFSIEKSNDNMNSLFARILSKKKHYLTRRVPQLIVVD